MNDQIAPPFYTTDIPSTLAYYKDKLGLESVGTWQDRLWNRFHVE
jgi:hypothetical protein